MPSQRDEVLDIIEETKTINEAAEKVLKCSRSTMLYVLALGLEHLAARRRSERRRELRAVIRPELKKRGRYGAMQLTQKAKERLVANTRELFRDWMINATISLGEATKEDLLIEAERERKAARGLNRNADFYEALAAPMASGQTVAEYWRNPKRMERLRRGIYGDEARPS